ncbi:PMT-domain-containing protein [Rhizoclosmatium globosum]|uniref:Dolichyl-phosphate-mannose--protein mannosyltransferase n=1 Tax=Rhizoclosmatium globosum TaxID=329046 RepID=A0A1Y2D2B2_9FUNG|nr:PMT-domain-containing protein [Rhizoclosmatium globosum]|eukprot:ORY53429.1 PMT-domain-containing protein [Rhizoclosmatium globosum]
MALTLFALIIRLFRISNPHEVVFDEVHFGGFATKYINGQFFMDVHPPLGKLLFAAVGLLGGYNSTFTFKDIGDDYLASHVPYVTMRLLPGFLGVLLVPVSYITLRNLGVSNISAILSALMLTLDNGFVTQSRLILLDSGLIFFTGLTVMMWTDFLSNQEQPFTFTWWYPLVMTGVSLGLAGSVKWVGLFLVATIGLSTLQNLWTVLGDLRVTPRQYVHHFAARALCLIIIPGFIYCFLFQIHFWALPNKGGGSGFMRPEFQSTLRGHEIEDTFEDVAYMSKIHLRHHATNGGYLHSHKHDYPTGSKQQQMTVYPFKDENGEFLIAPPLLVKNDTGYVVPVTKLQYLKNGDIVRLIHVKTGRKLHSHNVKAPVTVNDHHWEVSGYGDDSWNGDTNDNWIVRIADKSVSHDDPRPIKAINTRVRFIHVNNRHCGLFSHDKKLPEWGFDQQEVTCAENSGRPGAVWLIEANTNPFLPPNAKKVNFKKPGFFAKFIELHGTMWSINQGLTGKHPYESRPIEWPVLNRGILFWTEKSNGPRQIYLIGNPIVWWTSTITVLSLSVLLVAGVLLMKRSVPILSNLALYKTWNASLILFSGWFLHYFPFFLMKRQLFIHHYFPALYFAILSTGVIFELLTHKLSRASRMVLAGAFLAIVFLVYLDFSPLAYGNLMHRHHCERLKWGKHWDWTCLTSPEDEHDIKPQVAGKVNHIDDHVMKPIWDKAKLPRVDNSSLAGAGFQGPPIPTWTGA